MSASLFSIPDDIRAQLAQFYQSAAHRNSKRDSRPLELLALDCETDPFKVGRVPQPFIWGLYNGLTEEYHEFNTAEEVADHVRERRAHVYAHNGGKFDYFYLRDEFNTDENIMLINGRIAKANVGDAEFRDSLNIFPNTALADIGNKREIDYALMEPERRTDPNVKAEISLYLKYDCVELWNAVARYRAEYGKSLTQATASMRNWEQHAKRKAPRQTKAQHDRYRPFYYGGRVQCFESGCANAQFAVADINSAYPYAMLSAHPISTDGIEERHLPRDSEIYKCLIELDCTSRGAFPWRESDSNELYFPDDEGGARCRMRRYWITGWEFMAALELDAIANIRIRRVYTFTETVDFKDWILNHYEARLEADRKGDRVGKNFRKYMMNGAYGKFGANPEHYSEYVIASTDTYSEWVQPSARNQGRPYQDYQDWGTDRFLLERKPTIDQLNDLESRWRYYNVATAASITGYVRAYLFKALNNCSGLLYCDTDSIAARDTSSLDFGKGLGKWKHEGSFDRYSIAGKKLYAFHQAGQSDEYDPDYKKKGVEPTWKIASKGVAFHKMSSGPQIIEDLAKGGTYTYKPEVPTYSVTRFGHEMSQWDGIDKGPRFINREVRSTAKDIRQAPDQILPQDGDLSRVIAPNIYLA